MRVSSLTMGDCLRSHRSRRGLLALAALVLYQLASASTLDKSQTCRHPPPAVHDRTCPAPVDDESTDQALGKTPWTYRPYCLFGPADNKLCVYSSTSFNDGTGISIIATPETAATLVEAVGNPLPASDARRHINPGSSGESSEDVPYLITPIPGKGMGVIATRHIQQFETIMVGFPVMIVDNDLFPADEGDGIPAGALRLFQRALDWVADDKRVTGLARSREGREGVHVVDDVVRTNAFGITTLDGKDAKGLYPEIAVGTLPSSRSSVFW